MSKWPRINLTSSQVGGSTILFGAYDLEIENLRLKAKLIWEILDYQIWKEKEVTQHINDHLELKYWKVNEHIQNQFEYKEEELKWETYEAELSDHEKPQTELEAVQREKMEREERLQKIKQRHITDYTNNYDMDFGEVLGIPEITKDDLFKR